MAEESKPAGHRAGPTYRLLPNAQPDISFRYEPDRGQRMTTAVNRAVPNWDSMLPAEEQHPSNNYINCPRCGADNRNWLQMEKELFKTEQPLKIVPTITILLVVYLVLLFVGILFTIGDETLTVEIALPNFVISFVSALALTYAAYKSGGNLFSSSLHMVKGLVGPLFAWVFFLMIFRINASQVWTVGAPIAITIIVYGFGATHISEGTWRQVLNSKRIKTYLPDQAIPGLAQPKVQESLLLFVGLVIILPLFGYYVLPIGYNLLSGYVNERAQAVAFRELDFVKRDIAVWLQSDLNDENKASLTLLQGNIDRELSQVTSSGNLTWDEVNRVIAQLRQAINARPEGRPDEIQTSLETSVAELLSFEDALSPLPDSFPRRVLLVWFAAVGFMALLSSGVAVGEVNRIVTQANFQLPPPIFHSVAGMTRVVTDETRHALDVPGDMSHIQWMHAERNTQGGIDLIGLHRDMPQYDANGRILTTHVPAQRYFISTDMWGRICEARIRDHYVPVSVGAPGFVVNEPETLGKYRSAAAEPFWRS